MSMGAYCALCARRAQNLYTTITKLQSSAQLQQQGALLCFYMSCLHALLSFLVDECVLLCMSLKKGTPFGAMVIHLGPLSSWGFGLAAFQLGIWTGPLCASF